ncbi:MAG: exo-alpha-sialidase [Pirellulales bacterium]|nr:exo-alpha-sialidase [Pirellulales bacterium]
MRRTICATTILCGVFCFLPGSAGAADKPEIVSVKKIWDQAKHNAFTDLIRFKGLWWCAFRESEEHGKGAGKLRFIVSPDGDKWTSAALISEEGLDLRDPKLSIMPDGRLMCTTAAITWSKAGKLLTRSPRVLFSKDGKQWTKPTRVLAEDHWLWRVTWKDGSAWSMSKLGEGRNPRRIMLYTSTDGLDWKWVAEPILPDNAWNGSETTLRFLPDDTMVSFTRPEWIGTSRPPYTEWKWTKIKDMPGGRLGGPNFIRLPDGSLWGSARKYSSPKKTVLARMTTTSYEPVLDLPSGGDNSYAGMVYNENDGLLWMSYYSGHEGKASIYLAKIRIPLKPSPTKGQ